MPRRTGPLRCSHAPLQLVPSSHAAAVGYRQSSPQQRASAATTSQKTKEPSDWNDDAFAAPLILPGDDLALYPKYPPQSVLSWARMKERNEVTRDRSTIYVASSPGIAEEVDFMNMWTQIRNEGRHENKDIPPPDVDHVVEYLQAFYRGLPVKRFPPEELEYVAWEAQTRRTKAMKSVYSKPPSVGLRTGNEATRIRTRPSKDNAYKAQLNLDDLLWAAIAMLPDDAYALLLLVEQDLYQSADDEFVCGMAAGGSRVAVVSTARYHPGLDDEMGVEREHAWPASHCEEHVRGLCAEEEGSRERPRKKAKTAVKSNPGSTPTASSSSGPQGEPLSAAVKAHASLPLPTASAELTGLWLGRVCRTASHELGHCFGIDHCVYYACNMQGSASIIEDARQAPYLCPVDMEKVNRATGKATEERCRALMQYCESHKEIHIFAALGAWVRGMLGYEEA